MKSLILASVFTFSVSSVLAYEPAYKLSSSNFTFECTIPDHGGGCENLELTITETTGQSDVNPTLWNKTTNDIVVLNFKDPENSSSSEKITLVSKNDTAQKIKECSISPKCLLITDGQNDIVIREREYVTETEVFGTTRARF